MPGNNKKDVLLYCASRFDEKNIHILEATLSLIKKLERFSDTFS